MQAAPEQRKTPKNKNRYLSMLNRLAGAFSSLRHKRSVERWEAAAAVAQSSTLEELRHTRSMARKLRSQLNKVLHIADGRLTLPVLGSTAMSLPPQTDWSHRPEVWSGPVVPVGVAAAKTKTNIGGETTLFHDCTVSEISLRQIRNTRSQDLAPFGLRMDVFNFDGTFLSLVIETPHKAIDGLRKNHVVRLDLKVESEKPLEIFARLNIKHGPNTEQIVRELDLYAKEVMVEFDLSYTKFNEKRAERMWVDLIFEGPSMNQVTLYDLTLSRRPRAQL